VSKLVLDSLPRRERDTNGGIPREPAASDDAERGREQDLCENA
jgi:hypothetical protein